MSEPVPGQNYTTIKNDSLVSVAVRAYGLSGRESLLRQANPGQREPLVVGTVLNIPFLSENIARQGKPTGFVEADKVTLIIGGREIIPLSVEIVKMIDGVGFAWSAATTWIVGEDEELDALFTPFTYPVASLYIGSELIVGGVLYSVLPSVEAESSLMTLKGFSFAADVMDSSVDPPYEINKITLEDRANQLIKRFGIEVEFQVASSGIFERITADRNDKIGPHLLSLATQRGFLITSTPEGNILFTKADSGVNVGRIEQGNPIVLKWAADYDGRKRYHSYSVFSQSPLNNSLSAVSVDTGVPRARALNFVVEDATEGNIQKTADWKKTRQLSKAFLLSLPVEGWFAPNDSLWREGDRLTVLAPGVFVKKDFEFLIKGVKFVLEQEQRTAVLSLVPPQVFSGEEIKDPW